MALATVLALTSALLHAGWNLIAKRSIDPFVALWGQFAVAGIVGAVVLGGFAVVGNPLPPGAWGWALVSGLIHVPYVAGLAWAYRYGDFSLAYPIARGGGALFAALGGVVALDDDLKPVTLVAIATVVTGLSLLAVGALRPQVLAALGVATSIGAYTTVDSHASRTYGGIGYVFATFAGIGLLVTVIGVVAGRANELRSIGRLAWQRTILAAAMSLVTYGLVLLAVRRAPVGYVAVLRESSVLLAAVIGWKLLGEGRGWLRAAAAATVVLGLVVLVLSS